jgi:hypothetical protein
VVEPGRRSGSDPRRGSIDVLARRLGQVVPRRLRPTLKGMYARSLPAGMRRGMIAGRLRGQARACYQLDSPLYGRLLERSARDVERGGPCWELLAESRHAALGADDVLPLRFMAAVHRLVLEGRAPELARHFPSAGGEPGGDPWLPFCDLVAGRRAELAELLARPVQTNEVGRSAALLGGFLVAARATRLPLRLLEIGASAGLNLRWDRYRYEAGGAAWGDPLSPVRFDDCFVHGPPPLDVRARVAERRGCDPAPLDPGAEDDRLTLMSYVWADHTRRLERLRGALRVAQRTPAPVDRADAADWLPVQLRAPAEGVVTVVFHSFVTLYLDVRARRSVRASIAGAGARAHASAPLAWLQMEWAGGEVEVDLTIWPPGARRHLAGTDTLGGRIRWLGD